MQDEGEVAEEGGGSWNGGGVRVDIPCHPLVSVLVGDIRVYALLRPLLSSDVAILSAVVARLARLWLAGIADGDLAALVRVKMGTSGSAVAVLRDWLLVDVVHERTPGGWEAGEGDAELDTDTVGSSNSLNRATKRAALLDGESRDVASTSWVASDLGSRNDSRGLSADGRRRGEHGDE